MFMFVLTFSVAIDLACIHDLHLLRLTPPFFAALGTKAGRRHQRWLTNILSLASTPSWLLGHVPPECFRPTGQIVDVILFYGWRWILCVCQWFLWHAALQYLASIHDLQVFRLTPPLTPQSAQQRAIAASGSFIHIVLPVPWAGWQPAGSGKAFILMADSLLT